MYDFEHGIDRKAGQKRKRKEAKEVKKDASYLHTFYQDIRYYGVTIANIKPKRQIHLQPAACDCRLQTADRRPDSINNDVIINNISITSTSLQRFCSTSYGG